MAALLAMFQTHLCMFSLPCWIAVHEIAHTCTQVELLLVFQDLLLKASARVPDCGIKIPCKYQYVQYGVKKDCSSIWRRLWDAQKSWKLPRTEDWIWHCLLYVYMYASNFATLNFYINSLYVVFSFVLVTGQPWKHCRSFILDQSCNFVWHLWKHWRLGNYSFNFLFLVEFIVYLASMGT